VKANNDERALVSQSYKKPSISLINNDQRGKCKNTYNNMIWVVAELAGMSPCKTKSSVSE
jgi:hypothetical protein